MTQLVINHFDSKSKPHIIAAGWQAILAQAELYTDLCFMVGFHRCFLRKHFKFLQAMDDMTKHAGFRSHHILVRYYLMSEDMQRMNATFDTNLPEFAEYRRSLGNLTVEDRERQKLKIDIFFKEASSAM